MICLQIEGNRFKSFQITTNRLIIIDDLSASMSLLTPHKVIGGQLMTLLGRKLVLPRHWLLSKLPFKTALCNVTSPT